LRAALALNRELSKKHAVTVTVAAVLSAIAAPALIVDERGSVRVANSRAQDALNRGNLIRLDPGGRIRLSDPTAMAAVERAIRSLSDAPKPADDIAVRTSEGRITATVSLFPFSTQSCGAGLGWLFGPERLVLFLLRELGPMRAGRDGVLQRFFGLSAAEAKLATRIAAGETLNDIAGSIGISKETARTQLKSVLSKTDTHRQSELVALVAQLRQLPLEAATSE
jgi:DNA-binding CsgD family transcriptional regulator